MNWVGKSEDHVVQIIKQHNLEEYVQIAGFLPYSDVINELVKSDYGLLIAGDHAFELTTKMFDYLALNIPIIAIIKSEGLISRILSKVKNSYVLANNEESIYTILSNIYLEKVSKNQSCNIDIDGLFDRKKHAKKSVN